MYVDELQLFETETETEVYPCWWHIPRYLNYGRTPLLVEADNAYQSEKFLMITLGTSLFGKETEAYSQKQAICVVQLKGFSSHKRTVPRRFLPTISVGANFRIVISLVFLWDWHNKLYCIAMASILSTEKQHSNSHSFTIFILLEFFSAKSANSTVFRSSILLVIDIFFCRVNNFQVTSKNSDD